SLPRPRTLAVDSPAHRRSEEAGSPRLARPGPAQRPPKRRRGPARRSDGPEGRSRWPRSLLAAELSHPSRGGSTRRADAPDRAAPIVRQGWDRETLRSKLLQNRPSLNASHRARMGASGLKKKPHEKATIGTGFSRGQANPRRRPERATGPLPY